MKSRPQSSNRFAPYLAMACVVLGASTHVAAQETYRDSDGHFALTIPANWKSLPPDYIASLNETVQQSTAGSNVEYKTGFGQIGHEPGEYPYVLLQLEQAPGSQATYEQIEKSLGLVPGSIEFDGPIGDVMSDAAIDRPILDRGKNRFVMHVKAEVEGSGPVRGLSIGFLGKNHTVLLHCYATEADFPNYLAEFNVMLDSFRFDPGFAFVPAVWEIGSEAGLIGAAAAVVIAGLAAYCCLRNRSDSTISNAFESWKAT